MVWLTLALCGAITGLVALGGDLGSERRLLLAVVLAGAGGATLHGASGLANYIGNRLYRRSWTIYFVLRPFVGAGLAVGVYFYARTFLIDHRGGASGNYYGILATSCLAGLFSGSAVSKLAAIADIFFAPRDIRGELTAKVRPTLQAVSTRPLDRFSGFVAHRLEVLGTRAILRVWIQSNLPDGVPHTKIDVGEGPPAEHTRFRIAIYPDTGDAEPTDGELRVTRQDPRSDELQFRLVFRPDERPAGPGPWFRFSGLLEVSQRGRTVAVASFGVGVPG